MVLIEKPTLREVKHLDDGSYEVTATDGESEFIYRSMVGLELVLEVHFKGIVGDVDEVERMMPFQGLEILSKDRDMNIYRGVDEDATYIQVCKRNQMPRAFVRNDRQYWSGLCYPAFDDSAKLMQLLSMPLPEMGDEDIRRVIERYEKRFDSVAKLLEVDKVEVG